MKKKNIHEGDDWEDFKKEFFSAEEFAMLEADSKSFGKRFRAKQEKLARVEVDRKVKVVSVEKVEDKKVGSSGSFYGKVYAMSAGGRKG
jgi:ribosomal protein L20A (L18A)